MNAQTAAVPPHIFRVALALRQQFVLGKKFLGRLREGLAALERTRAQLAHQFQIPIFGERVGARCTFMSGAGAPFLAFDVGGALPMAAVGAAIDAHAPAHQMMCLGMAGVCPSKIVVAHGRAEKCARTVRDFSPSAEEWQFLLSH